MIGVGDEYKFIVEAARSGPVHGYDPTVRLRVRHEQRMRRLGPNVPQHGQSAALPRPSSLPGPRGEHGNTAARAAPRILERRLNRPERSGYSRCCRQRVPKPPVSLPLTLPR